MSARGSNVGDDSGNRNKTLAIVAVVLLGAAAVWLYFGRGQNLEEAVKEQVAAKQAANPAPAPPAEEGGGVAVPEENKTEPAVAENEQHTEEATPEAGPAKKKPIQAKAGRSIK